MRYKFFTIPIGDDGKAEDELNRFLSTHRVLTHDAELVHDGQNSVWAVKVGYLVVSSQANVEIKEKKGSVDAELEVRRRFFDGRRVGQPLPTRKAVP